MTNQPALLGIVIVTYNAIDVIIECLESLLVANDVKLRIVVVDNASTDDTVRCIRNWASDKIPPDNSAHTSTFSRHADNILVFGNLEFPKSSITLIDAGGNGGFAAGVNLGLAYLSRLPEIQRFWILNPDCVVPPETPAIFANCKVPSEGFSLIGGRILYFDPPHLIQSDGARVNLVTGVTGNINLGQEVDKAIVPRTNEMDFISGASMVASRAFYEEVGPLPEDYFLYYEEVAWALRRGDLPLVYCPKALVYHRTGTAIGSPTIMKVASAFSIYFMYRSRMIFVREHRPMSLPTAYGFAFAKGIQLVLKGYFSESHALFCAINGRKPPKDVCKKLSSWAKTQLWKVSN